VASDPASLDGASAAAALSYDDLRELARRALARWSRRRSVGRTSLVHETYVRLAGRLRAGGRGREHQLALAARAMRFVLIDAVRREHAGKRAGHAHQVPIDALEAQLAEGSPRLVRLHDALDELAKIDSRRARIVELRVFGGATVAETAQALGVSAATVHREWPLAKAWLLRRLQADERG
jgi:RNA polymerase sigma-70 factor, ECF subfamily